MTRPTSSLNQQYFQKKKRKHTCAQVTRPTSSFTESQGDHLPTLPGQDQPSPQLPTSTCGHKGRKSERRNQERCPCPHSDTGHNLGQTHPHQACSTALNRFAPQNSTRLKQDFKAFQKGKCPTKVRAFEKMTSL